MNQQNNQPCHSLSQGNKTSRSKWNDVITSVPAININEKVFAYSSHWTKRQGKSQTEGLEVSEDDECMITV